MILYTSQTPLAISPPKLNSYFRYLGWITQLITFRVNQPSVDVADSRRYDAHIGLGPIYDLRQSSDNIGGVSHAVA